MGLLKAWKKKEEPLQPLRQLGDWARLEARLLGLEDKVGQGQALPLLAGESGQLSVMGARDLAAQLPVLLCSKRLDEDWAGRKPPQERISKCDASELPTAIDGTWLGSLV
jgi:hypothetical protein